MSEESVHEDIIVFHFHLPQNYRTTRGEEGQAG